MIQISSPFLLTYVKLIKLNEKTQELTNGASIKYTFQE